MAMNNITITNPPVIILAITQLPDRIFITLIMAEVQLRGCKNARLGMILLLDSATRLIRYIRTYVAKQ